MSAARVGTVAQLWRYPVKSMLGERLPAARVSWRGIPGDRGWAVYDESRRGVTNAKRLPPLRACRAAYLAEPVAGEGSPPAEITLPGGARLRTDALETPLRLGEWLGRPVSLRALGPAGSEAAPRLGSQDDTPEIQRALNGILPGEPMPDMSAFPPERVRALRQGNFFDAFPIHLLTRATLDTLARIAPGIAWDPRRFRPSLLLDTGAAEGYVELGWLRRRLRAGTATLELATGCPRCVMTTQAFEDVPQDHRVMRTLVRKTKHTVGVYASVVEEGEVRPGDEVALLD